MSVNCKTLFQIFWTFLKISPVTFGAGYAMIPLIEKEIVEKKKWIKREDITDVFAIAESIPGAIALNSSTFIGFRIGGVKGAIVALLGIFLPTFMIVVLLSITFMQFQHNPIIEASFKAIRASIVALIVYAGFMIGKTAIIDRTTLAISVGSMIILFFYHIHPVFIILSGIFLGILLVNLKKRFVHKKNPEKIDTVKEQSDEQDYHIGRRNVR